MADDTRSALTSTYVLYDPIRHWVKIGRSTDVPSRVRSIEAASGSKLNLLGTVPVDREYEIHRRLREARGNGEWFRVTAETRVAVREVFRVEIPQRRQSGRAHPVVQIEVAAETWEEGAHCSTALKVAAIGNYLGLRSYRSAWQYLSRVAGCSLPPYRLRDAAWSKLLTVDPAYAFTLQEGLVESLEVTASSQTHEGAPA